MDLWNVKYDWVFHSGVTLWPSGTIIENFGVWEKVNRLNQYVDDKTIDNLDEVYFKFQKCISGLTYQYVLDLYDIYERNVMVGDNEYTELFYNEHDVINEYMKNFNYVDFYIDQQIDINERITKINGHYLKSSHKILVVGQTGKTENGVYTFDADGYLIKDTDLDTTGQTYRYGCYVKMDSSNNIEFFLQNSGNTFPITDGEMDFMTGHTYVLKNGFGYNINNTGTTYDSIPKLWFTDYNFARKLNKLNYSLYNTIEVSSVPTSTFSIQYRNNPPVVFDVTGYPQSYVGYFEYSIYSGKTILTLSSPNVNFCKTGDYLYINTTGNTSTTQNLSLFFTTVYSFDGTNIVLNEYIPNYILSGATESQIIEIDNLNNIKPSVNVNLTYLNGHYYSDFFTFSGETIDSWGGTVSLKIIPKDNEYSKYIDYDAFTFTFDSSEYTFDSDNHYINYKLYEHLNGVNSSVFDNTFDLGSGFTMTNFISGLTYLVNDSTYPQSITDRYSPIIITATTSSDLDNFYKYTSVYINGDYDDKVFILDKTNDSITIERPKSFPSNSGGNLTSISSYYSLTGISETLYDVYLNTGVTYYKKDDEFRARIYRTYNELLSVDSRIKQYTTGTITANDTNKYILKLYNYRNSYITDITGNTIGDIYYENDNNLMFKPLEIVDIGIDKQSKMPLLIYNDDLQISDTDSGHTVSIIKDSVESNITLVNGMTIEKLKVKYIWVFNAIIEDAIIGEDEYGLVWYKGTWVCGDWTDGTWYSGTWLNGTWKNGKWLSWLIDEYTLLSNDSLKKLDDNKKYSIFVNGVWRNGIWYNGIFGDDISISGYTSKSFLNHTDVLPDDLNVATWKNGDFYDGEFKNSIWENGYFISGLMYGGYWKNGKFNNGTFEGNWWDGTFSNSDFISGIWENGVFSYSRLGYNSGSTSATTTEWWDGNMNLSEVYAGLYIPINYNRTHWYYGIFRNSKWFGGHFFTGNFINSSFYDGVFGTNDVDVLSYEKYSGITFTSGDFINGLWINGIFINGNFRNGVWMDGYFLNGNLRTLNIEQ